MDRCTSSKASEKNAKTATAKETLALGQDVNFEALQKNLPKKRRHRQTTRIRYELHV
ncbi:hypothetical protein QTP88_013513 [Uroleucon formosanum]